MRNRMIERSWIRLLKAYCDNLKSKIQNRKWVGLFAVVLALTACEEGAEAQQAKKVTRIGFLSSGSPEQFMDPYTAFLQGLRDFGYIDGQNIAIEARWAEGKTERLPELAAELVRLKVDLIVSTGGTGTALAAKHTTTMIPVVFTAGGDLVQAGLISSLARPGGNLTGLSLLTVELGTKRLELLKETFPKVRRVAVLGNPTNPAYTSQVREAEVAAKALALQLEILEAKGPEDFKSAFAVMAQKGAGALLVSTDATLYAQRKRIVELVAKSRIPAIYEFKQFVEVGGLMSYGTNITDVYRRLAVYVDKIFKGAKPGELPVEQPTNFDFFINLKTAKALGVNVPPEVLARANKVIK
jgi:putative tryptophan/tyrosine transport system substrate-binding protein